MLVPQLCPTLYDPKDYQPTRLLSPWNSPGKNTGVGTHPLLQEIFLTQGSNPGLQCFRQILYHQSHQGLLDTIIKRKEGIHFLNHLVISEVPIARYFTDFAVFVHIFPVMKSELSLTIGMNWDHLSANSQYQFFKDCVGWF